MNTTFTLFSISLSYGIVLTYSLLFFAIFVIPTQKKPFALPLAFASTVSALFTGLIALPALIGIFLLALCLVIQGYRAKLAPWWQVINYVLLFALSIALMLHIVPGFNNPKLLDGVQLNASSTPYSLYLNFDKGILAFALMWFVSCNSQSNQEDERAFSYQRLFIIMAASIFVTFVLASVIGVVVPSFKLPSFLPLWLINNLLISCMVEEAFFRGFIQRPLTAQCVNRQISPLWAVAFVGILFGVAHFGGGLAYVLLACVIGSAYGYVYYLTGKLRYAVAFHGGFNLIHIVFFTYPRLIA